MNWGETKECFFAGSRTDGLEAAPVKEVAEGLRCIGVSVIEPREIRVLKKKGGALSGVFDDPQLAAEVVCQESTYQNTIGCYVTMNASTLPVTNQLASGSATKDEHIDRRTRLIIDVDPIRHGTKDTVIPATEEERSAAMQRAGEVCLWLDGEGWPDPSRVPTPNGVQLWWRIDIPAEDDGLVEGVLHYVKQAWPEGAVAKIDTTLSNASRLVRIPGTPGRKGDENSGDRPWRCGGAWEGPAMADAPLLETSILLDAAQQAGRATGSHDGEAEDSTPEELNKSLNNLRFWLHKHRVPNVGRFNDWTFKGNDGGKLAELSTCPWEPEHGVSYRPFVAVLPNGAWAAGCHGERCEDKHWKDFRAEYDPVYAVREQGKKELKEVQALWDKRNR